MFSFSGFLEVTSLKRTQRVTNDYSLYLSLPTPVKGLIVAETNREAVSVGSLAS